jgi:DNA polymerase III subunit delta'
VTAIIGHDAPISAFLDAVHGDRLHHGWLLTGPEGVGKASTAMAFATRLLCEAGGPALDGNSLYVSRDHPMAKLVSAFTHPDLKLLDRLPKDQKVREESRRDWPRDVERARSISVDQVRVLNASFATTPSMSSRRVVIIDAADDMERSAANALLKNLEEPPKGTIFLLVSHAAGRLLPTIRSRCRTLRFSALERDAMTSVLRAQLPEAPFEEIEALVAAGDGSPGRALSFAGLDVASIDATLGRLAAHGDPSNAERSTLAQKLAIKSAQARYEAFLARAPAFIAAAARTRSGDALAGAIRHWEAAKGLAQSAIPASLDPQSVVFALAGHVAALAPGAEDAKA